MRGELYTYLRRHYRHLETLLAGFESRGEKKRARGVSAEMEKAYQALEALKKNSPGPARTLLKELRSKYIAGLEGLLAAEAAGELDEKSISVIAVRLQLDVQEIDRVLRGLKPRGVTAG